MDFSELDLVRKPKAKSLWSRWHVTLILMTLPALAFVILFHYIPMGGLVIAFKDYRTALGIWDSPWTTMGGFKWFITFVKSPVFWDLLRNTLIISIVGLVVNTVVPIVYALFLNEVKHKGLKKAIQLIMYAPYFVSTMVVVGMLFVFLKHDTGILTKFFMLFGFSGESLMEDPNSFVAIYIISGLWQGLGWWSIIYMGSLANVDPNLHDAAKIDGAGRFRRIFTVNFPSILPLAIIMFIMAVGSILNVGFEKIYLMNTPGNAKVSNIISTYTYSITLDKGGSSSMFSYGTAIGLFNSIINIIILVSANYISKKVSENSLW